MKTCKTTKKLLSTCQKTGVPLKDVQRQGFLNSLDVLAALVNKLLCDLRRRRLRRSVEIKLKEV